MERVRLVKRHMQMKGGAQLKVVGIAGPGDPLANPKTFETFDKVKQAVPGDDPLPVDQWSAADRIPSTSCSRLGVHSITVTINALTPETGAKVYEWVKFHGEPSRW